MKLKKLLKDIHIKDVKGSKEIEITGICANSKLVAPGNLFVARKGRVDDGVQYIPEAIEGGAVAVLSDIYDPSLKHLTQIIHPDVNKIEGLIASHYYQFASNELFMVAVTGTNGKTTTSFVVKHLLDKLNSLCGLIGTIEYIIGPNHYQATRTTPDVTSNHKMLREMVIQGCQSAVMEVTSHALDQGRVQNIDYDVAIFTNLTLDHLDYHHTMDNYCAAKNSLFRSLKRAKKKHGATKTAIINVDSPWHAKISEGCSVNFLTYGIDNKADIQATQIELTSSGTKFNLIYKEKTVACTWSLIGRFNVYNYLAAAAVGIVKGVSLEKIVEIMASFSAVPGRLEAVPNELGLKIYVDFAHSDDALLNVLECLQEVKKGRIITIFGCGGDRDRSKRPKMAQAAESLSDIVIVTSDNPRSEDPETICRQIVGGFRSRDCYLVEIDRYKAIEKAVEIATPADIILIAGKGHEPYQIFSHKTIEFDDRKVASEICKGKHKATLQVIK